MPSACLDFPNFLPHKWILKVQIQPVGLLCGMSWSGSTWYITCLKEQAGQLSKSPGSLGARGNPVLGVENAAYNCSFVYIRHWAECLLPFQFEVGMMVRCCRTYEEVCEGDVGKVIKLDRDGLHDLNVQCDWQQKGGTYWVRYIHVELIGEHVLKSFSSFLIRAVPRSVC